MKNQITAVGFTIVRLRFNSVVTHLPRDAVITTPPRKGTLIFVRKTQLRIKGALLT